MSNRWGALMKRRTLAEYLDISEQAVERQVNAGTLPAPILFAGRAHWRKDAVDAALARLSGEGEIPEHVRKLQAKYGQAA